MKVLRPRRWLVVLVLILSGSGAASAQQPASTTRQKQDEAYAKRVREITADPRVITELVDHLLGGVGL